ncbi:MAG: hypothetical protein HY540_04750 [Deltaproteobacteria bacterium]|nr:hypothetical protein [Deltaproteobacteria bacterium]
MYRKLNLDRDRIDDCRKVAGRILAPVLRHIKHHSSPAIEIATLQCLGLEADAARSMVENLGKDRLRLGAATWLDSAKEQGLVKEKLVAVMQRFSVDADPIHNVLFGQMAAKRSFVDHFFAWMCAAKTGRVVVTREDVLLDHVDAYRHGHQALASIFLNEAFAAAAGIGPEHFSPTHAFAVDTNVEEGFLVEIAHAQVMREVFLRSPIRFTITSRDDADAERTSWRRVLFQVVGAITEQSIIIDENLKAGWFSSFARTIGDELLINSNGKISRRALTFVENTHKHLKKIEDLTLFKAFENGMFANRECPENEGKGLDGLFQKDRNYFNPLLDWLTQPLNAEADGAEASAPKEKSQRPQKAHKSGSRRRGSRGRGRGGRKGPRPQGQKAKE